LDDSAPPQTDCLLYATIGHSTNLRSKWKHKPRVGRSETLRNAHGKMVEPVERAAVGVSKPLSPASRARFHFSVVIPGVSLRNTPGSCAAACSAGSETVPLPVDQPRAQC